MPNSIKYKTGNLSGSLQKGNVALGLEVTGPSSTTGWYNGITPNPNQYIIYKVDPLNLPIIYAPSNQDELVRVAIQEGATNINTGSSTASILNYFAGQSNLMAVNTGYPSIVTDGLSLLLDASFTPSYPTTNSVWYNLSGTTNSTLINGPTFNNAGYITFDGVDDATTFPIRTFNTGSPQQGTFNIRMKFPTLNTASSTILFGDGGNSNNSIYLYRNANFGTNQYNWLIYYTGSIGFGFYLQGTTYLPGRWYDTTFTFNNTGTGSIYRNGELINSSAPTNGGSFISWNRTGNNTPGLNPASSAGTGSAQLFQWYNRPLTQQEILQNYYGGPIVTDGLVFAVDASNLVSYESGSTTTYSLTGSLSGSLINGTGFSNVNGGSWVFDGVDDYITFGTSTLITTDFTVENWFSVNDALKEHFLINIGYNSLSSLLLTINTYGNGTFGADAYYRDAAGTVVNYSMGSGITEKIHHIVLTRSGATNIAYINGITTNTFNNSTTLASNLNLQLGWAIPRNKSSAYLQGNIFNSRIYNRALSAEEVSQNFNAQRSRFGI